MTVLTGTGKCEKDNPKFPCAMFQRYVKYCWMMLSLEKPSDAFRARSWSADILPCACANMVLAGSPGIIRGIMKLRVTAIQSAAM